MTADWLTLAMLAVPVASGLYNVWQHRVIARQNRQLQAARQTIEQYQEVLNREKTAKTIAHDAYRLDADELDKRLQQDYRD